MEKIEFRIPTDDGYVRLKCPYCGDEFKVQCSLLNEDDNIWCPYCGLCGELNNFMTEETKKAIESILYNYRDKLINNFLESMESLNCDYMTVETNKIDECEILELQEEIDDMYLNTTACCKCQVKIKSRGISYFLSYLWR